MDFKQFLKEKGISEEDFAKKTPAEMAQLHSEFSTKQIDALKETVGKAATTEQVETAKSALENFKNANEEAMKAYVKSDDFTALKKALENAEVEITALKEAKNTSANGEVSFKEAIKASIAENYDKIKEFVANRSKGGWLDIEVKAPGTTTTTNITTATPPTNFGASQATTYDPFLRDEIFVEQYFDVGNTDMPSIPYVNETAGEGDAAIVAEGGLKPLIDADFNVKYSTAVKVAGHMKASEEALSDFSWLESAMTTTLKRKHDIARQNYVLGANGIAGLATPFNASILTDITVQAPQKYDAIVALQTAIAVQSEGVFMANVIFVNNIDALDMKLEKDADNNYLTPSFVSADGTQVDGIRVVAKPTVPVGTFIVGDFRNVNIRNVWEYMVKFGYENDDFTKNLVTMVGESRFHIYITDNEKRAIIAGTFADVITAITAV